MVGLMGRDTATTGVIGYDDGQAEGPKLVIGPWLGGVLGLTVGNIDVVGVVDGIYDGVSVGSKLGNELGRRVGCSDGRSLGADDGACEGASEGHSYL